VSWDWDGEAQWADRHRWRGHADPIGVLAVPAAIRLPGGERWDAGAAERCHALAALAGRELAGLGLEPLPTGDDEYAQMIAFRLPPCDAGR
jgi:hypothetical protein